MKRLHFRTIIIWCLSIIFLLSFLLLIYASHQLFTEQRESRQLLVEWENLILEEYYSDDLLIVEDLLDQALFTSSENIDTSRPTVGQQEIMREEMQDKQVKWSSLSNRLKVKKGALIGKLTFPKLDYHVPIIHGTEQSQLARGVGHYIGSAFPGEENNAVLAGHRETALRRIEQIEVGDNIVVQTLEGTYTYIVNSIFIVESTDRNVIVPHDEAILTLITCYPFNLIGPAPQRYIVTATLK